LSPTLVVDASVVVQACLDAGAFGPLEGHTLVGPHLLASEALSALHEAAFRGEISQDLARAASERLQVVPIDLVRPDGLAAAAWEVADALGWAKTYDAEYVALAQLLGCRLVTLDARLRRSTERLGFVISPLEI